VSGINLFSWWALSISFSSIFLTAVSIYLYIDSKSRRRELVEKSTSKPELLRLIKRFAFVWVLLGLLGFYISSVQLGASMLTEVVFAAGNIVVEAILLLYLLRNKEK
jgi:amino acid transporter